MPANFFFVRPRRFWTSLLCETLRGCYDVAFWKRHMNAEEVP